MTKKKKTNTLTTVLLVLIFLVGFALVLYPTVSEYWNSLRQSRAIVNYEQQSEELVETTYEALLAEAISYNQTLLDDAGRFAMTEEERAEYQEYLRVSGTDVIGYIEIEKINCRLPIYHGTGEEFLQTGIGHLEGSSLPVGGESTHAVLSGHCGLPSARLFTDLDQLEVGDVFQLSVLNETLHYEVDQIRVVEPHELDELAIVEGEDYCTLITCTPYGINSHRLLVRGHRIETTQSSSEGEKAENERWLLLILLIIIIIGVIGTVVSIRMQMKKRKRKRYRKGRRR